MKNILFVLFLLSIFTACNSGNETKKDYDQMAKDLCSCMRPLADVNKQIKTLISEGKTQEVSDLFTKVEQIAAEGELCATSLEEKYGIVEGESETKASAALKKHCPDIAMMLEQSESLGE